MREVFLCTAHGLVFPWVIRAHIIPDIPTENYPGPRVEDGQVAVKAMA